VSHRVCAAMLALLLAGCESMNVGRLWPFGEGGATEVSRKPANAAEYQCDGNRRFYVRNMEGGAVWLIAPDREIRLEKLAGDGRYGVGRVVLEISGAAATLIDPPGAPFTGCKKPA
jgi:hypothetical protein